MVSKTICRCERAGPDLETTSSRSQFSSLWIRGLNNQVLH